MKYLKNKFCSHGSHYEINAIELPPARRTIKVARLEFNSASNYQAFSLQFPYMQFCIFRGRFYVFQRQQSADNICDPAQIPYLPNVKLNGAVCMAVNSANLMQSINRFWFSVFSLSTSNENTGLWLGENIDKTLAIYQAYQESGAMLPGRDGRFIFGEHLG